MKFKYLPVIAVLFMSTGAFLNLWVDTSNGLDVSTQGIEKLQWMWTAVDLAVLWFCALNGRWIIRVALQQPWLVAFAGWCALSVIWSADPALTFRRSVALICTTLFGMLLGMKFETGTLLRLLAWALALAMLGTVVAALLFPSLGVIDSGYGVAWQGIFNTKNAMARVVGLALVVFLCLFWQAKRNNLLYATSILVAVVVIASSNSATGAIAVFLTVGLACYLKYRPRWSVIAVSTAALVIGLAVAVLVSGNLEGVLAFLRRDSTLSGRTELWRLSAGFVLQRPLLGAGWDGFWGSADADWVRNVVGWPAPHAHNGFLDMALDLGLTGLCLFLLGWADCFRRAIQCSRQPGRPYHLWPVLFLSYMFFYMFTESHLVSRHSVFYIVYCALSVSLALAEDRDGCVRIRDLSNNRRANYGIHSIYPNPIGRTSARPLGVSRSS